MQVDVYSLDSEVVKTQLEIADKIFACEPNQEIIKKVIDWQRQKARSGTHKVKTLSEVSGTGKKPFAQKGTGRARQGTLRSAQMRGGATVHGPAPRDYATNLPKKIRKLGLHHALSAKLSTQKLIFIDHFKLENHKTANFAAILNNKFKTNSVLIIGEETNNSNLQLAARNLPYINVVPTIGANVYDILRYDIVLMSVEAVEKMQSNQYIS